MAIEKLDWEKNLRPMSVEMGNKLDELIEAFNNLPTTPGLTIDDVYPVGSIYVNATDPTSPAEKFGGTWTQLTNTFLRATETPGTGGRDAVVLTAENIPGHEHTATFKGSATTIKPTATFTGSSTTFSPSASFSGSASSHSHTNTDGAAYMLINPRTGIHTLSGALSSTGTAHPYIYRDTSATVNVATATASQSVTPSGSVSVTPWSYTPKGTVSVTGASYTPAGSVEVSSSGVGAGFAIMPTYQGVYMWQRTA